VTIDFSWKMYILYATQGA